MNAQLFDATLGTFWLLIGAHFLADFPLQGDFLAKAKNHKAPIPGVPWWIALWAHSAIQGSFVGVITGSILLGFAEAFIHASIDWFKNDGSLTFGQDQALHLLSKVAWMLAILASAG